LCPKKKKNLISFNDSVRRQPPKEGAECFPGSGSGSSSRFHPEEMLSKLADDSEEGGPAWMPENRNRNQNGFD